LQFLSKYAIYRGVSNPNKNIDRRQKIVQRVAPWMAGLSLAGAVAAEASTAQAAQTKTEVQTAVNYESPKGYLNEINSRLLEIKSELIKAPGVKSGNTGMITGDPKTHKLISGTYYMLERPSGKNHNHTDFINMVFIKGQELPFVASGGVDYSANTKTGQQSGVEFYMLHEDVIQTGVDGGFSNTKYKDVVDYDVAKLNISVNNLRNAKSYRVGIRPPLGKLPSDDAKAMFDYKYHPTQVMDAYNQFFELAASFGLKS